MHLAARGSLPARRLAAIAFACATLVVAHASFASSETGTLRGRVHYEGSAPERTIVTMTADPACDNMFPHGRPLDTLVVGAGGSLANVIVYVKSGLPKKYVAPPASGHPVIDQKGCAFSPHVLAVRAGQEVEFHNSDSTFHNVNARTTKNRAFNDAMPIQDEVINKIFSHPEVAVKLKCDIHPWMSAYVGVFDHPFFAVTDADGTFLIPGIPEGEYVIEAWHESLGVQSSTVEIDGDKGATVDFTFIGK